MKIGDYVRTKNYGIAKITRIDPIELVAYTDNKDVVFGVDEQKCVEITGVNTPMKIVDTFYKPQDNAYILDYNSNIIDLIEVGDYVNGSKVYHKARIDTDDYGNDFKEVGVESDTYLYHWVEEKDIKSIVTKEQFESMEYKIYE